MGNRAVITASQAADIDMSDDLGVYVHWNGGRDSIEAFLTYCKLKGYRPPEQDSYGWARLCQVIGNFFGGTTSVGIDRCCRLDCDNWDNGTYVIKDWQIVGRKYNRAPERTGEYDLTEFVVHLDQCMPENDQIGEEAIRKALAG